MEAEIEAEYVRTTLFSTAKSEALLRPLAARDTGFQTGTCITCNSGTLYMCIERITLGRGRNGSLVGVRGEGERGRNGSLVGVGGEGERGRLL